MFSKTASTFPESEPVSLRFKRGKQTKLNLIYFWKGPVFVVGNANAVKRFNAIERAA